jgi:hypothetical protein
MYKQFVYGRLLASRKGRKGIEASSKSILARMVEMDDKRVIPLLTRYAILTLGSNSCYK